MNKTTGTSLPRQSGTQFEKLCDYHICIPYAASPSVQHIVAAKADRLKPVG
jgi:hypothetical protein